MADVERRDTLHGMHAGRTTHVHVRVSLPTGQTFVIQTYFAEPVRDAVYDVAPYHAERAAPYPLNGDEDVPLTKTMKVDDAGGTAVAPLTLTV